MGDVSIELTGCQSAPLLHFRYSSAHQTKLNSLRGRFFLRFLKLGAFSLNLDFSASNRDLYCFLDLNSSIQTLFDYEQKNPAVSHPLACTNFIRFIVCSAKLWHNGCAGITAGRGSEDGNEDGANRSSFHEH